ncbi:MAG: hypothetical protein LBG92_07555 [Prevotellaceae bacterium]|jgi:hypothetical protein|nr:hypothetical protein [Prevotellaceae bacterium]
MKKKFYKIFPYAGFLLLAVAFAVKWTGCSVILFGILLSMAVALKTVFLISVFRTKGFRPDLGFYLILTGVAMILLFLLFKEFSLVPVVLQRILFYGAISLKITGLIITIYTKKYKK